MLVGWQKLGAMLNLHLIEYRKNLAFAPKRYMFPVTSNMFIYLSKPIFLF